MKIDRQDSQKFKKSKYRKYTGKIVTAEIAIGIVLICSLFFQKKENVINNTSTANAYNITNEVNTDKTILESNIEEATAIPVSTAKSKVMPTPKPTVKPTIVPEEKEVKKVVALTFDDGPNVKNTLNILKVLEDNDCTATFFVLGACAKKYPDIVKEVYDAGMEIGNHSYNHENFKELTKKQGLSNLNKVNKIIYNITDENPTLFRPPGGNYNDYVQEYVPFPIIYWAKDSNDWRNSASDKTVISNIMNNLQEGDIILCHDRVDRTLKIIKIIIPMIKKKGYDIKSVSEMFNNYNVNPKNGEDYSRVKVKKNKR